MKVLVAGGTGFVGTALVRELTAHRHDVSVLARSPENTDLPTGVDRIALDLTRADGATVREALAGHDSVVNLVALSPLFTPSGGNGMHETVHLGGTEALVGLLLVMQGLVVSPQTTSVECTSSSSANATGQSPPPDCVRTTDPATGQRLYILGLGAGITGLGVAVILR